MIDVMMFLLVFFVLISINVIPALGLKTKLPLSSTATQENPPKRVIVTILKDGVIQLEGQAVSNLDQLSAVSFTKQEFNNNMTVVIQGDEAASMQQLIDVMDTLKKNSIESMTISARRK
jgi:biopolymer transport protein ExbD